MKWHKLGLYVLTLIVLTSGILFIFWKQEYRFSRPTAIPKNLKPVKIGDKVDLAIHRGNDEKGLFIHFFNHQCPCSRFNIKEFRSMVRKYRDEIDFVAVIQSDGLEKQEVAKFKRKYDLGIPVLFDEEGKIAYELGVYSTPQAVILKPDHEIYYRGNYNRARFCTAKNTQFTDMALAAYIKNQPPPKLSLLASLPFGCPLPGNDENEFFLTQIFNW